jgi:hypothetical protein
MEETAGNLSVGKIAVECIGKGVGKLAVPELEHAVDDIDRILGLVVADKCVIEENIRLEKGDPPLRPSHRG